jgi:regulatory protein
MSGRITALTVQKRNYQRVNVSIDGEYAFGLARIVAAWLEVGQELSDEKIARLKGEDAAELAYQRALRLLNTRPRSRAEIRDDLDEAGVEEADIERTLERLTNAGLLNDQRFAREWVENRTEFRPRSRRALAQELRRRGVEDDQVRKAVQRVDEDSAALSAARKQARRLSGLAWPDFRQKLIGFLARRGFNYETSASAAAAVWAELNGNDTEERDENGS